MFAQIKRFPLLLSTILIAILLASYCNASTIDEAIRQSVMETDYGLLSKSMSVITYLGDGLVDYSIASVLPDKEARIKAQHAVIVSGIAAFTLKRIIGMKRPPGPIEFKPFSMKPEYHAMPSGHTATAFALAAIISDYYPTYERLSYAIAALVGVSRLYEDAHWFSNVVAGAGVGYLSAKFVEIHW